MKEKIKNQKDWFSRIISVLALLLTIINICVSVMLSLDTRKYQEQLELDRNIQAAIPIFRLAENDETDKKISVYPPYREPQVLQLDTGILHEAYFSIRNFAFENMTDNIAYISHVEYGGEAFELQNSEVASMQEEIVGFSEDNLFVGAGYENEMYFIAMSKFGKYYSYRCKLAPDGQDGEVYCYKVISIDMPVEYDINNDVYKNRYIYMMIDLYPGNIIF